MMIPGTIRSAPINGVWIITTTERTTVTRRKTTFAIASIALARPCLPPRGCGATASPLTTQESAEQTAAPLLPRDLTRVLPTEVAHGAGDVPLAGLAFEPEPACLAARNGRNASRQSEAPAAIPCAHTPTRPDRQQSLGPPPRANWPLASVSFAPTALGTTSRSRAQAGSGRINVYVIVAGRGPAV
jgi:hypothetical protein